MAGYWQRPDETARVMTADGYFRTGDVAVMQPDGQVRIVDRMKDMVLVSGFNVYPNEVEDVLAQHPGVLEAAVIGVPDEHSGEIVAAYVVRRDDTLTAEELREFCRENLTALQGAAPHRVPREPAEDQCRQGAAPGAARRTQSIVLTATKKPDPKVRLRVRFDKK